MTAREQQVTPPATGASAGPRPRAQDAWLRRLASAYSTRCGADSCAATTRCRTVSAPVSAAMASLSARSRWARISSPRPASTGLPSIIAANCGLDRPSVTSPRATALAYCRRIAASRLSPGARPVTASARLDTIPSARSKTRSSLRGK